MIGDTRTVLVIGQLDDFIDKVGDLLTPPDFVMTQVDDVSSAVHKIQSSSFNLLLVEYREGGTPVRELFKALRWSGSSCRNAVIVLLAEPDDLEAAEEVNEHGTCRILNPAADARLLKGALIEILDHDLRYPVKALVRINGKDLGHKGMLLIQTKNLSSTGMLVRFDKPVLIGGRFTFSLETPGLTKAIEGIAVVVRSHGSAEHCDSFAAHFIDFKGDGRGRLRRFLETQPKPPEG